jgi:hypothetical protein
MLKCGLILTIVIFSNIFLLAQNTGIYEAGVTIDGVNYEEPGNSFNNKSIIKTSGQKFNLTSAFVKTYKHINSSNICKGYLFYRIYAEGETPPQFNRIECNLFSNSNGAEPGFQNQLWQNNNVNIDMINHLTSGRYLMEVYYGADASNINATNCNQMIFFSNGISPFKALITITPPLNVHFTGFTTATDNEKVLLNWQIDQVITELQYFIVEKSRNGVKWKIADTVSLYGTQYNYIDNSPFDGVNFYRLIAKGGNKTNCSFVRRIYVGRVDNIVTIYPNPVYENLRFQMTAIAKGKYDLVIYNSDGTRVSATAIEHDGNDNYVTLHLPKSLQRGIYWLVLYSKSEFYKRSFTIQ